MHHFHSKRNYAPYWQDMKELDSLLDSTKSQIYVDAIGLIKIKVNTDLAIGLKDAYSVSWIRFIIQAYRVVNNLYRCVGLA